VGGCSLEDAEAVAALQGPGARGQGSETTGSKAPARMGLSLSDPDPWPLAPDPLDLFAALVDKSLLRQEEREAGDARLTMLETIREYAIERLEESGELDELRRRHAHHFLGLAEAAASMLHSAEQGVWLERLELEHDNLRAALGWCQEAVGSGQWIVDSPAESGPGTSLPLSELTTNHDPPSTAVEIGLRLAGALWPFWYVHGYWTEGRERLESLLAPSAAPGGGEENSGSQVEVSALPDGERRAVPPLGPVARREPWARALDGAGVLAHTQGDYAAARAYLEESLAIRRELCRQGERDGPQGHADSLNLRGLLAIDEQEYEAAQKLLEEALSLLSDHDHLRRGKVLHNLALVASRRGSPEEAQRLYEAALQHGRSAGDVRREAETLANLGVLAHNAGDLSAARRLYLESLALRRGLGDRHGIGTMLNNLAELAEASADVERAVLLFTHAERIFQELGSRHAAVPAEALRRLNAPLDAERWRELLAQADAMTWEDVVQQWQE
jgi:tetratricopeptide (TPR) repeat protein